MFKRITEPETVIWSLHFKCQSFSYTNHVYIFLNFWDMKRIWLAFKLKSKENNPPWFASNPRTQSPATLTYLRFSFYIHTPCFQISCEFYTPFTFFSLFLYIMWMFPRDDLIPFNNFFESIPFSRLLVFGDVSCSLG